MGKGALDAGDVDDLIRSMNDNFKLLMMHCTPHTQTLHLCRHPGLSSSVLTSLNNLTGLQELRLHNGANGRYSQYRFTDELPNLKVDENLSEATLTAICMLPLKKLRISWNGEVDDHWLRHLGSMISLEELDIAHHFFPYNPVTNDGIMHITSLIHLRVLNVSHTRFADDGMNYLQSLKHLRNFIAIFCCITGASLDCLCNLEYLRYLNFSHNPITDVRLKEFHCLKFLEDLDLSNCCGVTDLGLQDLSVLTWLKHLDVCDTSITFDGASWLESAMPDVKIEHY